MISRSRVRQSLDHTLSLPWLIGDGLLDTHAGCHAYLIDADKPGLEVLLTDVKRDAWRDYWVIKFEASDELAVTRVAEFLHHRRINIVQAKATTAGNSHVVRLGVDCRKYRSPIDPPLNARSWPHDVELEHLKMGLVLSIIDLVDFFGDSPNLEIRRNSELWKLHHQAAGNEISIEDQNALGIERPLRIHHGGVKLPPQVLRNVRARLAVRYGLRPEDLTSPLIVESMDASSETLRIMVTYQELGVLPARVSFRNVEGALEKVTNWLHARGYDFISQQMISSADTRVNLMMLMVRDLQQPASASQALQTRLTEVCAEAENSGLRAIDFHVLEPIADDKEDVA